MRIVILILLFIFAGNVVYSSLFADKKVMREIQRKNYMKAFHYSKYCPSRKKQLLVLNLIRNDFRSIYSNLDSVSEKDLDLLIDYMNVLPLRPEVYYDLVEKVRKSKNIRLMRKLRRNTDKPAWALMVKQDIKNLQNAE